MEEIQNLIVDPDEHNILDIIFTKNIENEDISISIEKLKYLIISNLISSKTIKIASIELCNILLDYFGEINLFSIIRRIISKGNFANQLLLGVLLVKNGSFILTKEENMNILPYHNCYTYIHGKCNFVNFESNVIPKLNIRTFYEMKNICGKPIRQIVMGLYKMLFDPIGYSYTVKRGEMISSSGEILTDKFELKSCDKIMNKLIYKVEDLNDIFEANPLDFEKFEQLVEWMELNPFVRVNIDTDQSNNLYYVRMLEINTTIYDEDENGTKYTFHVPIYFKITYPYSNREEFHIENFHNLDDEKKNKLENCGFTFVEYDIA